LTLNDGTILDKYKIKEITLRYVKRSGNRENFNLAHAWSVEEREREKERERETMRKKEFVKVSEGDEEWDRKRDKLRKSARTLKRKGDRG